MVAGLVPGNLGSPEVGVGFRNRVVLAAVVAVPESSVDEDDSVVLGEDDVGFTGQSLVVHPVAEASVPEGVAQLQLRLGRGGVYGSHIEVAHVGS